MDKVTLNFKYDFTPLQRLQMSLSKNFHKAMGRAALQFLTWCNQGSPKEPAKPPIKYGILRGSSSAFVGKELVGVYQQAISSGATEKPTPAKSHNGKELEFIVGWNTDYAAKMHEWEGNWGKFTEQDGDAGAKWIEKHLTADKEEIVKMIANDFGKYAKL
jgi:hypothetical protein